MSAQWTEISSNEAARSITEKVCWDDSSLLDSIFCHTTLMTKEHGRISGFGLRVLISCCSAPSSILELAFLEITESVPMPIDLSYFSARFAENGQLRFGFNSGNPSFQCQRGFYRFTELNFSEASHLYRSPSILEPPRGQLATEGYADFETIDGGQVIVSGKPDSPKLFVQAKGSEGSEVQLDSASSKCLVAALHFATTAD
jgi:hypothetical protein